MEPERYDPQQVEPKWAAAWEEQALYRADENDTGRPRFYALGMFPYPSGDLHMGHLEAFSGGDVIARHMAWNVISGLRDLGKTVFLTTHFMDEAEALADRIVILAAGRIVASGTPRTIGGRDGGVTVIAFTLPEGMPAAQLPPLPGVPEQPAHPSSRRTDGWSCGCRTRCRRCTPSPNGRWPAACRWPTSACTAPRWRTSTSGSPPATSTAPEGRDEHRLPRRPPGAV